MNFPAKRSAALSFAIPTPLTWHRARCSSKSISIMQLAGSCRVRMFLCTSNCPTKTRSVVISSNTLIFRKEGLQVGLVRDGKAVLVPVKIGHDFGNTVEIISGLQPTDAVIVDPSDSLVDGMPVRVGGKSAGGPGK